MAHGPWPAGASKAKGADSVTPRGVPSLTRLLKPSPVQTVPVARPSRARAVYTNLYPSAEPEGLEVPVTEFKMDKIRVTAHAL